MPLFVKGAVSVLYIHVPKTGGTSIEQMFVANGFRSEFLDDRPGRSFNRYRRCSPQHLHAQPLLMLLRPVRISFIFMTVRHPISRILSEYKMQIRVAKQPLPLVRWVDQIMKAYVEDPYHTDNHFRPQHEFLIPGCDVFRQEKGFGPVFLERLAERTGVAFAGAEVAHHNRDEGVDVDEGEIENIRPIVRQFYREDFTTFGYRPNP
jgi:hypothetical protein